MEQPITTDEAAVEEPAAPSSSIMTVPEVAEYLGLKPVTVYAMIERGKLKAERHGRQLIVRRRDAMAARNRPKAGGWRKGRPRIVPS